MPYQYGYDFSRWYDLLPGWSITLYWLLLGISIAAMWILFAKAHEEGWASIIPFYNTYVLFKITWGSGWLFLLLLIPFANIVIGIITMVKLAHVFGKDGGWAVGLIFLNTIFICIMAFDDSIKYIGVNGEYADDYGSGGKGGPGAGTYWDPNARSNYQSREGYQNPYGQNQDSYRQSAGNTQYYYKETGAASSSDAKAQPSSKFCPNCGEKLENDEKFCPKCGTKQ